MLLTWSIAQGIKHGILLFCPNIWVNELLKLGAACIAGKAILPIKMNE